MNPKTSSQVQTFKSDGLTVTASEPWFKVKVQVISKYLEAFTAHVAGRVDEIIFVDLHAGSGYYSFGHQKEIFASAGLQSLQSGLPISQWVFCEQDASQLSVLKTRLQKYSKKKRVSIVEEINGSLVEKLQDLIPKKYGTKVAVFCLIDPFSLDVPFSFVEQLGAAGWSLLMPFTFPLNKHSHVGFYLDENHEKLMRYLGHSVDSLTASTTNWQFYQLLVRTYENNLLLEGFNTALSVHKVESQWMNVPAYYMGFFSKRISSKAIQQDVQSLTQPQFELF